MIRLMLLIGLGFLDYAIITKFILTFTENVIVFGLFFVLFIINILLLMLIFGVRFNFSDGFYIDTDDFSLLCSSSFGDSSGGGCDGGCDGD